MAHESNRHEPRQSRLRHRLALWGFLGIALFFLWTEHRAHLLGVLPYLLLLACPLMHLFMHGGHRSGHGTGTPDEKENHP
ncbi:DUF2933 domain-containing protein [Methylococcus sp. ANG]|uniref:DUF2933 domain-containing protein n=1 Tax=Methylococcus sp. ANG TaxID=3231903 RepID=UPI003C12B7AC